MPHLLIALVCALPLATRLVAQSDAPPATEPAVTNAAPAAASQPESVDTAKPPAAALEKPDATEPAAPATKPEAEATEPVHPVADGEKGLRLNFRGAPLELVLNYLSEAAGFIIVPETDVKGKVDVWSNQPLTKDEAVDVLNQVLSKNGYAVLRNGRTLTLVSKDEAKKRDIPVVSGYEPSTIPKTDAIVTQIIPVRFINAVQLSKDLSPLLPASATMTANEGGNALVITDTQTNIRRLAEIIKALDTTVSSLSAVRVFNLKYADAKSLATVLKDVFATTDSSRSGNQGGRMFNFARGGPPGMMGGDTGGGGNSNSSGRPGASRVVATADERSNSLIVSAPDDLMPTIETMVSSMDTPVDDITDVRVFRLKNADPVEMADLLTSLFPDERNSSSSGTRMGGMRFGGPGGGFQMAAAASGAQSDRQLKQTRVIAVADQRTGSVVVTASRDLMLQIEKMVEQLDQNPAKKQKVFVYELKNADIQNAEDVVRNLFQGQNSRTTSSSQNSSALETRQQQMINQQNSGFNSSGFGSGSGGSGRLQ